MLAMQYLRYSSWSVAKRPSNISVPEHAHPLVRLLLSEMARQRVTYQEMEFRSNVLVSTLKSWRKEKVPGLPTIEACLGAVGWSLVPVPFAKRVPAWVKEALDDINERWSQEEPLLHTLLASACGAPIAVLGAHSPKGTVQ